MSSLRKDLRGTLLFGLAVVGLFLVGGVLWAVSAPLSGAVIANGVISFESERKTVQHLEGGIIKRILVKEGDAVEPGTTLLLLDDTQARARADELRNRIRTLAAEEARLHAERAQSESISFDHLLLQPAYDAEIAAIREQQTSHFQARISNLTAQREVLTSRIEQLKEQTIGLQRQLKGTRSQMRLIREEAAVVSDLLAKGFERRPRLLALRRTEAQLMASDGELTAAIAQVREAIGETEMRIINLETNRLERVDARLTTVQSERISAEKLFRETLDRLSRTRVISPIEGVVLDVGFKTVGGVVGPGEPILQIVPHRDELIIKAHIQPTDIDEVSVGSPATVAFSAFLQRHFKRVNGEVVHVSADAFEDQTTNARFFLVDVKIDKDHLAEIAPDLPLTAGMPADVFITTSERTLAEYLVEPVKRTFQRAFRES